MIKRLSVSCVVFGAFIASPATIEAHLSAKCRPLLGLSFGNATAPSAASLGPMCPSQQGFTCCSLGHAETLATWSAMCQDAAAEHLTCCADLLRLRCLACDGAAAIGLGKPICRTFADKLWASCSSSFLASDSAPVEGAWPAFCSKDALLCTRFDEMWSSVDAFLVAVGLPPPLSPGRDLDSPGCWDGSSQPPTAEMRAAIESAAVEAGLTLAAAVDVAQKDRRRRERARNADAASSGDGNAGSTASGFVEGAIRSMRTGLYSSLQPVLGTAVASFLASRVETLLLGALLLLIVPVVAGRGLTARRTGFQLGSGGGLSDAEVRARRAAALRAASSHVQTGLDGPAAAERSQQADYDSDLE